MADDVVQVIRGIVLRETRTRESDKILTLLTGEMGKITVVARGIRKRDCAFAAAAQPLVWSEWTLYRRGAWLYAREASTLELFTGLRQELERLALGCYFAEVTETVTVEDAPAEELLRHLLNGLYALSALQKPLDVVKPAFEMKLLSLAGYEPLADCCAVCGAVDAKNPRLDPVQGVIYCASCAPPGNYLPLCRDSLAALRHILYGNPKRLYGFSLTGEPLRRLIQSSEGFLMAQLEHQFPTLTYYKSLRSLPG